MATPIRIVVDTRFRHAVEIHTSFPLQALNRHRGDYSDKGLQLYRQIQAISGVCPGEMSVQITNNMIYVSKLVAFDWKEIIPQIADILKSLYGHKKIKIRYQ